MLRYTEVTVLFTPLVKAAVLRRAVADRGRGAAGSHGAVGSSAQSVRTHREPILSGRLGSYDVLLPVVPTAERKRAHLSNNEDHLERGCSTGPSGEDAVSTCSTTIRRRAALTLGRSMSRWGDHTAPAIGLLGTNVLLEASSGEVLLPLLRHC